MPATNTITSTDISTFVSGLTILASEVQGNSDVYRGNLLPVDPTASAAADNAYNLGSSGYRWKDLNLSERILQTTQNGITANAGGGQTAGVSLVSDKCFVSTAASSGDSVTLPTATGKESVLVFNGGAAAVDLFPAIGDQIDSKATNTALSLGASLSVQMFSNTTGSWITFLNATSTGGGVIGDAVIGARASSNNGAARADNTTIDYEDEDFDTNAALASGVFTCPTLGLYHVHASVRTTFVNRTAGESFGLEVQVNSIAVTTLDFHEFPATRTTSVHLLGGADVSCALNERITVVVQAAAALAFTSNSVSSDNVLSIHRVGDVS